MASINFGSVKFSKYKAALALFILALVLFNITFAKTHGWAHIFWSLLAYASLFLIANFAGLNIKDTGLSATNIRQGLKYAAYAIALITSVFLVAFLADKHIFQDSRYHHSLATALYSSLIILPLKTIIFEELAFRGILLALLLKIKNNQVFAITVSSAVFGLWHIITSTDISTGDINAHSMVSKFGIIVGTVLVTSAAGAGFSWLRLKSQSLAAPIAVHWFINGLAIMLASFSWR